MHSSQLLSTLVAAGLASAASTCTKDIKVTEPTPTIDCDVVDAKIEVDKKVGGALSIEGPKQIKGDLIIKGSQITSISSSSINSIGGKFQLDSLELLETMSMSSLESVDEVEFVNLNRLNALSFSSDGVSKVRKITIADTYIDDLSGFTADTVEEWRINNNRRLKQFAPALKNITGTGGLVIQGNGAKALEVDLSELESASELQFQDIKSVKFGSLEEIKYSIKFDDNENLQEVEARNLTEVDGTVSFINNDGLKNVSMPQLESVGGGFVILNNTKYEEPSFPKLEVVKGGIRLGGAFESVELPELDNVKGSSNVTSTKDIKDFCQFWDDAKDDGKIEGKSECTSKNKKALEGGKGGEKADGSSDGSSEDDDDEEDAAGSLSVNYAIMGLAAIFGVAQLL